MSDGITVKMIGDKELSAWFHALSEEIQADALVEAGLAGGLPIQNAGKTKAPKLTRTLSRSIHMEVASRTPQYVLVEIGTDLEYAAIQEFGGVISAKNVQYLTVPLTEQAKATVTARAFPGKLTPVFRKGASRGALVDESGMAQFALVKSVTIPAQPYMRPALDEQGDNAAQEVGRVLAARMDRVK